MQGNTKEGERINSDKPFEDSYITNQSTRDIIFDDFADVFNTFSHLTFYERILIPFPPPYDNNVWRVNKFQFV